MGRLTYSARKISGIKAGQVVSKDLRKRIPPSTGSKVAARDPTLEIDLTGKSLTDEGFAHFIDDLIECTTYRSPKHPLGLAKVTEFHLSGNTLTVSSLAKLGTVIANNPGDLRELDLSANQIVIETDDEKRIWKGFLDSFKNCYVLQKLDLSGNPMGVKGLEILARIYVKSDLDYLEADADAIVRENHGLGQGSEQKVALAEEVGSMNIGEKNKENDARAGRSRKSPAKGGKAAKQNGTSSASTPGKALALADLKKHACTRGLRSIPYFILSNLDLKNSSAVHISHMLNIQRASSHLLAFLPPGKASAIPECAQDSRSLLWQPNKSFTSFSKRLLDVTESLIDLKAKAQSQESSDYEEDEEGENEAEEFTDETARLKLKNKLALDFTRLTKRVRIECLKQEGVRASEIVSTALKMMIISRALLLDDNDRGTVTEAEEPVDDEEEETATPQQLDTVPEESKLESDHEQEEQQVEEEAEEQLMVERLTTESPVEYHTESNFAGVFAPDYVSGPFHPAAHLFDEDFPALQPATRQDETQAPIEEKTPSPEPAEPPLESSPIAEPDHINTTAGAISSPASRSGRKGTHRSSVSQKPRKTSWRFCLPFEIWRRIISDALDADGILDAEQQTRIIDYASDWDNVAYELTIKGAEDHQQIWKIIDTVGCFIYSPLS